MATIKAPHIRDEALITQVAAGLSKGKYYSILGSKYSGKTQLIRDVFDLLGMQGVFLTVWLDLSTVSFLNPGQLLAEMCETLEEVLPNRISETQGDIENLPAVERIAQAVSGVQPQVIMAIDHLESVPEYAARVLLGALRTLFVDRPMRPDLRNLSVVIAAASSIFHLTVGERSPFNIAEVVWMQDLEPHEALKLVREWCKSNDIEATHPAVQHIAELTGGCVSLINSIMKTAVGGGRKERGGRIRKADVDVIVDAILSGKIQVSSLEACRRSIERDPFLLDSVSSLLRGESTADVEAAPDITRLEASGAVRPRQRTGQIQSELQLRSPLHRLYLSRALRPSRLSSLYAQFARWKSALHYAALAVDEEGIDRMLVQATGLGAIAQAGTTQQVLEFLEVAVSTGYGVSDVEAASVAGDQHPEVLHKSSASSDKALSRSGAIEFQHLREVGFIPVAAGKHDCRVYVAVQQEQGGDFDAVLSFVLPCCLADYTEHKPLVAAIHDYMQSAATAISALKKQDATRSIIDEATSRLAAALGSDMIEQKIFLAHPYSSPWLERIHAELTPLLRESAGLSVVHPADYPGGGELWDGIAAMLTECEAGFFELTIPNENVCFELGFCIAAMKPYYVLRNVEYGNPEGLPSLVRVEWWIEYRSMQSLMQKIRSVVDHPDAAPFFFKNKDIVALLPSRPRKAKLALVTANVPRIRDDLEPRVLEAAEASGKTVVPIHVEEFRHAYDVLGRVRSCGFHCAVLAPDAASHAMRSNAEACIAIGMMAGAGGRRNCLILQETRNRIPSDVAGFCREYGNVVESIEVFNDWMKEESQ